MINKEELLLDLERLRVELVCISGKVSILDRRKVKLNHAIQSLLDIVDKVEKC